MYTHTLARTAPKEPDEIVARIFATYGMRAKVADACGIRYQAVQAWKRVPPHWVQTVAKVLDLPPEEIRPDIFRAGPARVRLKA
jgi:hypothetical protein